MGKKLPYFFTNRRGVVSNSLDRDEHLIIGDSDKIFDIKIQYLICTFQFTIFNVIKKIKDVACASIDADDDGYTQFHFSPLIEKNKKLPSAFFCLHDYTAYDFGETQNKYLSFNDLMEKSINKKKYLRKKIRITSGKICFFPVANELINQPFDTASSFNRSLDLVLISLGKNRTKVVNKIKKFKRDNRDGRISVAGLRIKKEFDVNMSVVKKMRGKKKYREILIKSFKGEGYKYREFIEFSEELEKCGAKLEIIDTLAKPFEQYDLNSKEIVDFQKELNSIKKQKNKKNGLGNVIQCSVENGVYEVYEIPIRISDEEYEGRKIPRIHGAIFVIKK